MSRDNCHTKLPGGAVRKTNEAIWHAPSFPGAKRNSFTFMPLRTLAALFGTRAKINFLVFKRLRALL
jgi:hypothetical protein